MGQNRTSYKSAVNTDLPSASNITASNMRTHLQDELSDNVVFRLDVSGTQNKSSGVFSIDFADVDLIQTAITGTSGSTVTFLNLEAGDIKYWRVTKSAGETITFSFANDCSVLPDDVDNLTLILFRVTKKVTTIYVEAIKPLSFVDSAWTTPSLNTGFTNSSFKYRKNKFGQLELKGMFYHYPLTKLATDPVFTFPVGYRPTTTIYIPAVIANHLGSAMRDDTNYVLRIDTDGDLHYSGNATVFPDVDFYINGAYSLD